MLEDLQNYLDSLEELSDNIYDSIEDDDELRDYIKKSIDEATLRLSAYIITKESGEE
jgi:predicted DNA-binding ArsR family transcriptional regulator